MLFSICILSIRVRTCLLHDDNVSLFLYLSAFITLLFIDRGYGGRQGNKMRYTYVEYSYIELPINE